MRPRQNMFSTTRTNLSICLAILLLFSGCAVPSKSIVQTQMVQKVDVGETPPRAIYTEIGPISAHDGNGCGGFGLKGDYEKALKALKEKAAKMGAGYVEIKEMIEPHLAFMCFDNKYLISGTAYKFDQDEWVKITTGLKPLNARYRIINPAVSLKRRPFDSSYDVKNLVMGGILHVIGELPSGWMQIAKDGDPIGWVKSDFLKQEQRTSTGRALPVGPTDTTPPSIVISSHNTGRGMQITENLSRSKITGRATDPSGVAEVRVNGQTTSLDEDGNFAADVFLKVGDNTIVITAMDIRENIKRKTFKITRNPKTAMVPKGAVAGKEDLGRFYALIIGNNDYVHLPKLETARNDAVEIEKILREQYGFETEVILDATRSDIMNGLNKIRNRLGRNDSFLFYYAGHGEFDQSSDKTFWLPVDAEPENDANWIIADSITSNIKRFSSNHVLIIADSCYSGTMTRSLETQVESRAERDKYLQKMLAKPSRTLMASGGNEPVTDIGGEGHSIFASVLLKALRSTKHVIFTAEELFYNHIRESVAGRAEQTPEYSIIRNSGHDGGDFLFVRK